ncbi:MAG TPA: SUMF1/EgtB/PvdO family nonheme iron enzyme, partial [Vicinamibacteria bacterium]
MPRRLFAALLGLALLAAGAGCAGKRVSIAVGAFEPIGIERRQADQAAEEVRKHLASKRLFRVFLAEETKGAAAGDPLALARRLKADKAVVGSMERSGGRLVLKARLVDVESGLSGAEESVFFDGGRENLADAAARLGDWLADSLPLVVAVTSRAGETVALDAGRSQGLAPGMLLRFRRGAPPAPADATQPILRVPGLEMELVRVAGGEFTMGDIFCLVAPKEGAFPHRVRVSDFYLGRTEVNQGQWAAVMSGAFPSTGIVEVVEAGGEESVGRVVGGDPRRGDVAEVWSAARSRGRAAEANPSEVTGSELPVTNVSWPLVQEFLLRLNRLTGARYRLPTEAEWEYAARSRGRPDLWAGNHDGEGEGEQAAPWEIFPSPAGSGAPNALGLHGLSRGPREWCADRWSEWYYEESPPIDPPGPEKSFATATGMRGDRVRWEEKRKVRVVRGGVTTRRGWAEEEKPSPAIGFRLALSAEPAGAAPPPTPPAVPATAPVRPEPSPVAGNLPPADYVEP